MTLVQKLTLAAGAILVGAAATTAAAVASLPASFEVSRSAIVRGTPDQVEHLVSHFPDRLSWVPWTEQDPQAVYTFDGEPTQPGATMAWKGEVIGEATLTLVSVDPGREVVSSLDLDVPVDMTSTDRFVLQDLGDGRTRVTWIASGDLAFGPDRLFGLFADGMLGPDYETGLAKLDAELATLNDRS